MQSTVYAIAQGPKGLIYLGTERGVVSFDGYRFDPLEVGDLEEVAVSALGIDSRGYLLVGTVGEGLYVVDLASRSYRVYGSPGVPAPDGPELPDSGSLEGSTVMALESADSGRWWVGTNFGLQLVELGDQVQTLATVSKIVAPAWPAWPEPGWGQGGVICLRLDGSGKLWIAAAGGVASVDTATLAATALWPPGIGDLRQRLGGPVLSVEPDGAGRIFLGFRGGLARLDLEALSTDGSGLEIWPSVEQPDSIAPNATGPGVDRPSADGPSAHTVRSLWLDRQGLLWVGTAAGLDCFEPSTGRWRSFRRSSNDPTSPSDDNIRTFFEDASGLLWIGTTGGGAVTYDPAQQRFARLGKDIGEGEGLSHPFVWSIQVDPDRTLWVGTAGGGLDRFDGPTGEVRRYRHRTGDTHSLGGDHVLSLHRDGSGSLWVGTTDGFIDRLDESTGRFEHFGHQSGVLPDPPAAPVQSILEDRAGELWTVSWGGGLGRIDPPNRRYTPFPMPSTQIVPEGPMPPRSARAMALLEAPPADGSPRAIGARPGALWIATYGAGFHTLDADRQIYRILRHRPGDSTSLVSDRLVAMAHAAEGGVWLGTNGGELAWFDPQTGRGRPIPWRRDHADLEGTSIYSIIDDHVGRLWLGTNRGLVRHALASGDTRRFDTRDGLQSPEHNAGAIFRHEPSSELFFGGILGVDRFFPDAVVELDYQPPVVLTSIRRFGQEMQLPTAPAFLEEIELSYRDRYVSFELASLDFRNPRKNRFSFRLDGQDEAWIDAGTHNRVSYTNLSGGKYTLQVRGSNSDGVWNQEGLSLAVRVVPPFWQTLWFRVLAGTFLLATVLLVPLLWYRRQLALLAARRQEEFEARRRLLEAREKERVRVARELHDGPLQDLLGLSLAVERRSSSGPGSGGGRGDGLDQGRDEGRIVRRAVGELRRLCGELRPSVLARSGLAAAIESHVERLAEDHPDLHVELDLMEPGGNLADPRWSQLYRIFQEALANVVKHARAESVRIVLEVDCEGQRLEIVDDGRGFEPPEHLLDMARRERYGLLGMAERAELIGGRFGVVSASGMGTEVWVEVPADPSQPDPSHTNANPTAKEKADVAQASRSGR